MNSMLFAGDKVNNEIEGGNSNEQTNGQVTVPKRFVSHKI